MRKQLVKSVEKLLGEDLRTVLLLGDIGVFGFRNSFANFPDRTYNIGILEQSTIGVAAGLSKTGLIPFVHTIAPFLVERSLEQLKVDFGYQELNGNFISVGASYDYAALGPSHHCPGDVLVLSSIPNMQIIVPGNAAEFDTLINEGYNNGAPTYYRLSEKSHNVALKISFGRANLIKEGKKATIVCFGSMLGEVYKATVDLDITLIYYTSVNPFDGQLLKDHFNEEIIICEPFYEGSVNYLVSKTLAGKKYSLSNIGVPREFLFTYGTAAEQEKAMRLDSESIRQRIREICTI